MNDQEKLIAFGLIVALGTIAGGAGLRALTRGIRNNNPGNIRRTGISWQGEVTAPITDRDFEQFVAPEWGIRAIRKELEANFRRGERSVREIITEWAPPSENPTGRYIAAVAQRLGVEADDRLDVAHIPALVDAIIVQENGFNPYPPELMQRALALA